MTVEEYIAKQKKKLTDLKIFYKPFEASVRNVVALQAKRIFTDGQKSDGSPIGQYNTTTPFYVNPNLSAGATTKAPIKGEQALKPTTGKHGDHLFKNGKEHKTTWVANYKSYRNRIGKRIDKVNLTLSGDLMRDFSNAQTPAAAIPVKISDVEYRVVIKRDSNIKKKEGNEDRFGTIFKLTKKELDVFKKTLNFNFKKAIVDG